MTAPELEDKYQFRTEWSEEDQEWVGPCVGFPLMSWLEPDSDAAEIGTRSVVAEVIEILKAEGQLLPPPSEPTTDEP